MAVISSLDDRGHKTGSSAPAPDALLIPIHIFLIPSKAETGVKMATQDGNIVDYSEWSERDANWYLRFKAANHEVFNNPINRAENTENGPSRFRDTRIPPL
ncbi:hypothetical protein TESG_06752 [Trichophyton tonsurans CBS 112818]|uniref:Uncharacterized protein n=2 Tax=Trichophyton TaxID=5550 RepID=F2PWX6_TRIEC|nr:hypothetical protein TESG_06752 [Trichophyton tonsurans CBS 112818]EGE06394.1 hypothetical protein TEQG_05397 [Trichophyton equinum CBS 127.97]